VPHVSHSLSDACHSVKILHSVIRGKLHFRYGHRADDGCVLLAMKTPQKRPKLRFDAFEEQKQ
jgi:hypothetical protein